MGVGKTIHILRSVLIFTRGGEHRRFFRYCRFSENKCLRIIQISEKKSHYQNSYNYLQLFIFSMFAFSSVNSFLIGKKIIYM
eukprot:UN01065